MSQEGFDCLGLAMVGSGEEGSFTPFVESVDIGFTLEQELHGLQMTFLGTCTSLVKRRTQVFGDSNIDRCFGI